MAEKQFEIDPAKFYKMLDAVWDAYQNRRGIFHDCVERFLPQYNLPDDLQGAIDSNDEDGKRNVALWLFVRGFCDKRVDSGRLMRRAKSAYENPERRWLFLPEEVVKRDAKTIHYALTNYIVRVPYHPKKEKDPGYVHKSNSEKLLEIYGGDPRKIIHGKDAKLARKDLMAFGGIGKGISNMILTEFLDLGLALIRDPENALFKIDTPRARIPLFSGSVIPSNGSIHFGTLVGPLEQMYLAYCNERRLTVKERIRLDQAIWVTGSEGCDKHSYTHCSASCPLFEDFCKSTFSLNKHTGRYTNGKYLRSNRGQLGFYLNC